MAEDSNGKEAGINQERSRIIKIITDRLNWLGSMYDHEVQNLQDERLVASITELEEILKQIEKT
jgi:hypothetical protein